MESERFDGLVRSVGQPRSRRQTLRAIAGAVAVGAFAVGEREVSAARCKPEGRVCKTSGQCCARLTCQPNTGKGPAKTCQTDPNCPQPASTSTYSYSCSVSNTCVAGETILRGTCQTGETDYWTGAAVSVPAEIIVNTCANEEYVISNCSGTLTCGNC